MMAILAETPNLRPHLGCMNALFRWKEGQPLQSTAGAVTSSTQKDVTMLSLHTVSPAMHVILSQEVPGSDGRFG